MTSSDTRVCAQQPMMPTGPIADHGIQALTSIARTECPVLLMGEHGVGKRTTAREIHSLSRRSHEPYRELPCRDLDCDAGEAMLEVQGTAYLSEVAGLSLAMQELLTETYFHSNRPPTCRLLFGSSREILQDVNAGRIREDFFYLISAITVRIAPLRLRKAEILRIVDALVSQYCSQFYRPKPTMGDEINAFLMGHNWPDNFPELQTAMKTLVAIGDQAVSIAALKAAAGSRRLTDEPRSRPLKEATRQAVLAVERQMISEVLRSTCGNRKRAAIELGISYKALLYKIKQFGFDFPAKHDRFGVAV